ncbi:MAG: GLUG motif-containing protein [Pseudomonadota bacterium]
MLLLLVLLPVGSVSADFAGGDGSAGNPWRIASAGQLDKVRNDLDDHYILVADIDLAKATGSPSGDLWNGGAGWEPIGRSHADSFIGSLDGNGFKITGLFIDRGEEDQVGLFGWAGFGAQLSGLALEEVDITGASLVSALVVTNYGGTVDGCYVTGTLSGDEFVGALVGRNLSGTVSNSYATGHVSGTGQIGGLVGSSWSRLSNSHATGRVTGESDVGGLVGRSMRRMVSNSYWNIETSGQPGSSGGGTGLTSNQMRQQESFAGFDFDVIWQLRNLPFPVLSANPQDTPPVPGGNAPAFVPPGTDLTGKLPAHRWTVGDGRVVPDLSADMAAGQGHASMSTIAGIRLPEAFGAGEVLQDRGTGELGILSNGVRATVLPYSVRQAASGRDEGVFINEDGDVVLVTANDREVLAYPVVADPAVLDRVLGDLGLKVQYDERAMMRLSPVDDVSDDSGYQTARADVLAVPASSVDEEGLYFRDVPGLQGAFVVFLAFTDENGILMQQDLVPVPAHWSTLKEALASTPGMGSVRLGAEGIISVAVGGQTVRGRMEYEVSRRITAVDKPGAGTTFSSIGDINGDGTEDFRVMYPDGDSQLLLIFP